MRTYARMAVWVIAALGCLPGCSRSDRGTPAAEQAEPHYALTGEVLAVDHAQHTVRIRHDAVKGLMPAMTMDFPVSAGDEASVRVGEMIRGTLVRTKAGDFRLERIWPNDQGSTGTIAAMEAQLRANTSDRGRGVYREIGETVPDFALYDQDGRVVQMSRFRGKQIMLNFIYTRCPIATMCPAATLKMMATQKLARDAGIKDLELVSITLDPAYDTPGVLKEYASARGIDTSNFSFLTGPEAAIKDLLKQFGVIAEFQGNILNHTLTTLLINEDGRIAWRADGSQWEPADFVARMHKG
ncbi:MAG TPA: SCO family protein [Opitutaceae bacterium]|nr:SCO family protein [Opitutaceae bacterium]